MPMPVDADTLSDCAHVRHGFFTREGGVSHGLYASLNCGVGSGDLKEHVAENRARVAAHFGTGSHALATLHQIHSARAIIVDGATDLAARAQADALVTRTPGLVLGVLSADCAPVLFADPEARVVGAAHAGWKGALAGICEATVAAMEELGGQRARIRAAVGPAISQRAYEVGPEFEARFIEASSSNRRFFAVPSEASKRHFDLQGFVASRLESLQLETVEVIDLCTHRLHERFFSFRRATQAGDADYGRQLSAIVVT